MKFKTRSTYRWKLKSPDNRRKVNIKKNTQGVKNLSPLKWWNTDFSRLSSNINFKLSWTPSGAPINSLVLCLLSLQIRNSSTMNNRSGFFFRIYFFLVYKICKLRGYNFFSFGWKKTSFLSKCKMICLFFRGHESPLKFRRGR